MSYPFPPTPRDDGSGVPEPFGQPYPGAADPYGYQPQPYNSVFAPEPAPTGVSGLAIASLITAFLFPPLAIIFGHLALSQIKSRNEGGRGIAVAGLVLGYVFTVVTIIGVILLLIFFVALVNEFDNYRERTSAPAGPSVIEYISTATGSTIATDSIQAGSVVYLAR